MQRSGTRTATAGSAAPASVPDQHRHERPAATTARPRPLQRPSPRGTVGGEAGAARGRVASTGMIETRITKATTC